jgi:ornithine carbamoyltransferase
VGSGLHGRHFLKELDFTAEEWHELLDLAAELKADKKVGKESPRLTGKNIALIFEKTSTRTRCAFEVAAYDQGAHTTFLDPTSSQLGHKESVADTAQVLGRMYDAIEYRGSAQSTVETLAQWAGVPVYNGLTDEWHPTQMLCDALTMREHAGKPAGEIAYAFCGDARGNVAHSLLITGALMGMDVRMVAPESLQPDPSVRTAAAELASDSGARITITDDAAEGVRGVDFVHTDVWVSMGEPKEIWYERIELLSRYQVNDELLKATGNSDVKFMHCLPAFHDTQTMVGRQVAEQFGMPNGVEVTDEVFTSPAAIVFDQAENRMHTIKAILVATLAS